jgi:hypothetical protein
MDSWRFPEGCQALCHRGSSLEPESETHLHQDALMATMRMLETEAFTHWCECAYHGRGDEAGVKPSSVRQGLTRISHRCSGAMTWRRHSCLPSRHSCRRFDQTLCQRGEQASRRVSTRQAGVPAPHRPAACEKCRLSTQSIYLPWRKAVPLCRRTRFVRSRVLGSCSPRKLYVSSSGGCCVSSDSRCSWNLQLTCFQ